MLDARGVGISNTKIQLVCPGQPARSLYTHEGILFNPLSYALIEDALTHPGPGLTSRLDLTSLCAEYATTGLSVEDVLATESVFVVQTYDLFSYPGKVFVKPPLMPYAQ